MQSVSLYNVQIQISSRLSFIHLFQKFM